MKNSHIRDEQQKVDSFTTTRNDVDYALKELFESKHLKSKFSKVTLDIVLFFFRCFFFVSSVGCRNSGILLLLYYIVSIYGTSYIGVCQSGA